MVLQAYNCVLRICQIEESLQQLFVQCYFAQNYWATQNWQVTLDTLSSYGRFQIAVAVTFLRGDYCSDVPEHLE